LLSNAVKYTRKGGFILGCRRRADKLRIEVHDTGLGIPEGQLRAIFEEFHQIDNPARELSRGLGLGLAIVQRLADLLGLTIDVRSREGRGSVFTIEVPLTPAGAGVAPRAIVPASLAPEAQGGSILIVEDDPALRGSLELFLNTGGYLVTTAVDGDGAIRLVEQKGLRPDLVIVDYNLPRAMTGLQVMARLHEALAYSVPALVLTGDTSTHTQREIAARGFDHRTKPVAAGDLIHLVRRLLSRPKSTAPQVGPAAVPAESRQGSTIFLIDDDHTFRETLTDLLRANGRSVEDFASAEAFLASYRPEAGGVLLVDAMMPGMGGLALLDRLRADGPGPPVIVITGVGDVPMAVRALRAGAFDFIQKPVSENELTASLDRVLAQTRSSFQLSASRSEAAARIAALTARQHGILDRILAGQPSKTIAADLGISQRTVDAHRAAIMKRTGSRSLSELVRLAVAAI